MGNTLQAFNPQQSAEVALADHPHLHLTEENELSRIPPEITFPTENLQTDWEQKSSVMLTCLR